MLVGESSGLTPDPIDFCNLDDGHTWHNAPWELQECYYSDTEPAERKTSTIAINQLERDVFNKSRENGPFDIRNRCRRFSNSNWSS